MRILFIGFALALIAIIGWLALEYMQKAHITITGRHEAEMQDLNAPAWLESQRQQDELQAKADTLLGLKQKGK